MSSDKQQSHRPGIEGRTYRGPRFQPLRRAVKLPVWGDLSIRLGAALFLIFIVIMVHWWDREGLVDNLDGDVSFLDVVYFTMISITTTGFGDIIPISDRARLVEAVIVTPIRFAVFFIFVGTAYNFIIKRSWEKWRMARIQEQLSDHIVVLGYGVSGSRRRRTDRTRDGSELHRGHRPKRGTAARGRSARLQRHGRRCHARPDA